MRARISKWGNSLAIRLPKALAVDAGLEEGALVELTESDGRLIIAPLIRDYSLDELVRGITQENRHDETDWGQAMGSEVW